MRKTGVHLNRFGHTLIPNLDSTKSPRFPLALPLVSISWIANNQASFFLMMKAKECMCLKFHQESLSFNSSSSFYICTFLVFQEYIYDIWVYSSYSIYCNRARNKLCLCYFLLVEQLTLCYFSFEINEIHRLIVLLLSL